MTDQPAGSDSSGVAAEIFIAGAEDWGTVGDVSPGGGLTSIMGSAMTASLPTELASKVKIGGIVVSSTDPDGPGGLAEDISSMVKFSESRHVDWGAVQAHRKKKK